MAHAYAISGSGTNTDGYGLLGVVGSAAIRPVVYDIIIGARATPADYACTYDIARSSGAGTGGSAVTPNPLATPDFPAATSTAYQNATGGATKGVVLLSVSCNQRATFRWVAAPGSELVCTMAANAGIYSYANTPSTAFAVQTTFLFTE
jgi:hypothetical protein